MNGIRVRITSEQALEYERLTFENDALARLIEYYYALFKSSERKAEYKKYILTLFKSSISKQIERKKFTDNLIQQLKEENNISYNKFILNADEEEVIFYDETNES